MNEGAEEVLKKLKSKARHTTKELWVNRYALKAKRAAVEKLKRSLCSCLRTVPVPRKIKQR